MKFVLLAVLFCGTFATRAASAKQHDLLPTLQKKQSVISGVLNPGSVSFNGQEIFNKNENYKALLINKKPVTTKSVMGLETFHVSSDESTLVLEWLTHDGKTLPLLKVSFPAVTEFNTDSGSLFFGFNEFVTGARLDSTEIDLQKGTLPIDNFKSWIDSVHTFELRGENNAGQIFNLDFQALKDEILTQKSLTFSTGDGPFSANEKPTAVGVSLRILKENNVSYECAIHVAQVKYVMGTPPSSNPVTQATGQLKGRAGYNPFDSNYGGFSFKRWTLGLQAEVINYKRESEFASMIDGQDTALVNTLYFQAGSFIRWEPYQQEDWGVFFNLDLTQMGTNLGLSHNWDIKTFGIAYYF